MHPRNIYRNNPANFAEIGQHYEKFRQHLIPTKSGGFTINFKDPKALRELTVSLLHYDFDLKVELPLDRLIPTIPQRLNYIHWIEDLLDKLPKYGGRAKGIDIGTGASCVYPLLGSKINGWKFIASEVDDVSFRYACENVKRNNLEENIHVKLVTTDTFLKALLNKDEQYDFCMCNPPFFSDEYEATGNRSRTGSRPQPSSVCTGTGTETVTSGGEVEFIARIIEDSLELKTKIKWYTTMLGKKSSVAAVVSRLKDNNIQNIVTTEFCQGRTMRWGVAWTFLPHVTIEEPPKKKRKSKPLEFTFQPNMFCEKEALTSVVMVKQLVSQVSESLRKILLEFQVDILSECEQNSEETIKTRFQCGAKNNTWAHQRRKRREAARRLGTREKHGNEVACGSSKYHIDQTDTRQANEHLGDVNCTSEEERTSDKESNSATHSSESATIDSQRDEVTNAATNDKIFAPQTNEKDVHGPLEVSLSKSDAYFIEFVLEVGVKLAEITPGVSRELFLRMEWVNGQDRNSLYQLFQYFQNRFGH